MTYANGMYPPRHIMTTWISRARAIGRSRATATPAGMSSTPGSSSHGSRSVHDFARLKVPEEGSRRLPLPDRPNSCHHSAQVRLTCPGPERNSLFSRANTG
ncbi:hypothetical protein GCM10007977_105460 [Dactylosporangium sucinum]|uniref:Uncharacterized protein n=1 Tax=Dactylosporangium sucinum TaxID=1424081 RepID=A0A917UFW7_9ACTN|nr:hypothetical protein GCM10007977_105460 [Dactylosporangium sucinum]